ncbi:hypothetical protein RHMOL_Rhmol12G0226400 [Rhododendron molle]|nr:hypothetical protein RHMOL_Rhmol12G0226400 [Rhododendron molle]KAI8529461.1 hypothetical protein RHMOL_Rhmol12G0226400 [Rhododendron molle]
MSRSQDTMSVKQKRQESNAQQTKTPESVLLSLIKSKGDMGIWKADMKRETNLPEPVVNKALKVLQGKNLIKEVVNVKSKGRKHYMATEFQPSKEVTGGSWYADGDLDIECIRVLRGSCLRLIKKMNVATTEGISEFITRNKITKADCTSQQIEEILSSMVLDSVITEVKSTGLGDYHSIPTGAKCYRAASGMGGAKIGAMGSIPCRSIMAMGEVKDNEAYEEELLDYEEEDEKAPDSVNGKPTGDSAKKGYVGIHSSGFRDFLLKPELLRAIVDSGFEHPSEGKFLFTPIFPFTSLLL